MKVVNLLAHTITDTTTGISYKPNGMIVRANSITKPVNFGDLEVNQYSYELTSKLPEPKPDTVYVVSNMALNAIPEDRLDFVGPGPVEKNEYGKPIGCRGFRVK